MHDLCQSFNYFDHKRVFVEFDSGRDEDGVVVRRRVGEAEAVVGEGRRSGGGVMRRRKEDGRC